MPAKREPPAVLLLVGALSLVSLPLFARLPAWPRIWNVLNNAAHAPVFGALALVLLALFRRHAPVGARWLPGAAIAMAVLTGAAVEWIQHSIGRQASWADVLTDALGATCAISLSEWLAGTDRTVRVRPSRHRTAGIIALLSGTLIALPVAHATLAYARRAAQFPLIAQFDSPLDEYFVTIQSSLWTREYVPPPWSRAGDDKSLRLRPEPGPWPGVALTEPERDWRGYTRLNLDVTNPNGVPLDLIVRVHDTQHDLSHEDRFNESFVVEPRSRRTVSIAVDRIARGPAKRQLDLSHIAGIIVYAATDSGRVAHEFYLTRVWLDRVDPAPALPQQSDFRQDSGALTDPAPRRHNAELPFLRARRSTSRLVSQPVVE